MTVEVEDHLAHYGKLGMKWGKHKAARQEKNARIDGARGNQAARKAEIRSLTKQRISERSTKGKARLDQKIADKKFEIKNHPDAEQAAQLKAGEKVMKGVKIGAMLGMSVVGLGAAASILNTELNNASGADHTVNSFTGGSGVTKYWSPGDQGYGKAVLGQPDYYNN